MLKHIKNIHTTKKNYKFSVEDVASGVYLINFHYNTGRESLEFVKNNS